MKNVDFADVNAVDSEELALELGVKTLPSLHFYRGGRLLDAHPATKPNKVHPSPLSTPSTHRAPRLPAPTAC